MCHETQAAANWWKVLSLQVKRTMGVSPWDQTQVLKQGCNPGFLGGVPENLPVHFSEEGFIVTWLSKH